MREDTFVQQLSATWGGVEEDLTRLDRIVPGSATEDAGGQSVFLDRYRRLCQHLALARYRGYSQPLVGRLNDLAVRGHHHLYRKRPNLWRAMGSLLVVGFPSTVRREWRLVGLAHLLFYVPFVAMVVGILRDPVLVYSVVDGEAVASVEAMYTPVDGDLHTVERSSDSDVYMFGFYIYNNIGIAFRTFAGGMLLGAGSVFFLLFNGFFIGAVAGHLTGVGLVEPFWSFVVTHGSFELTAIVLSGAAGLRLGLALLAPGRLARADATKAAAVQVLPMVYGVTIFLLVAAFLEAFWSSSATITASTKYAVGGISWLLVYAYLLLSGRGHEA